MATKKPLRAKFLYDDALTQAFPAIEGDLRTHRDAFFSGAAIAALLISSSLQTIIDSFADGFTEAAQRQRRRTIKRGRKAKAKK